jgi:hypothetical protein
MPNLYAIQFDVVPQDSGVSALFNDLERRVQEWVEDRYRCKWGVQCAYPTAGDGCRPLAGHYLHRSLEQLAEHVSLSKVRWQHPDDRDSSLSWATDVTIARSGSRLQFALQLGLASASFAVRPMNPVLGRPRIVTSLLTNLSCWAGSQPIVAQKQTVASKDIASFVETQLFDSRRVLPYVVVSCDNFTDCPLVDADRMQQRLLGFAQVVVIDRWAAFALTDCVGKALSCFNGCVRIYWPGLVRTSDPRRHWLYFPAQLERFEYLNKPLGDRLFEYLAQLSVFRFVDGEVIREVQGHLSRERQNEAERLRVQIEAGRTAAKSLKEIQELFDLADKENKDLRLRLADREKEVEDLLGRLRDVQANFALIQQQQALEGEGQGSEGPTETSFETVSDALAAIEDSFGGSVDVLETARSSAARSDFPRPNDVHRALTAVCEIGKLYLESEDSIGTLADHFREQGFTQYAPNESDTVKNDHKNYARHREFMVKGEKRRIYQHIDIGGGDKKACLQIYFDFDRQHKEVIIAHCGRHLPIPRERS